MSDRGWATYGDLDITTKLGILRLTEDTILNSTYEDEGNDDE